MIQAFSETDHREGIHLVVSTGSSSPMRTRNSILQERNPRSRPLPLMFHSLLHLKDTVLSQATNLPIITDRNRVDSQIKTTLLAVQVPAPTHRRGIPIPATNRTIHLSLMGTSLVNPCRRILFGMVRLKVRRRDLPDTNGRKA